MKIISRISHELEKRTSEISCSTREINFIFSSICVLFCLLYKKVLLPHKNRAVYSNAFHDNWHTRLSILFVEETSIKHIFYIIIIDYQRPFVYFQISILKFLFFLKISEKMYFKYIMKNKLLLCLINPYIELLDIECTLCHVTGVQNSVSAEKRCKKRKKFSSFFVFVSSKGGLVIAMFSSWFSSYSACHKWKPG